MGEGRRHGVARKERGKRYYRNHREEVKKKREEHYAAHRQLKREYSQLHYRANRERVKEKRSEHYKAHKEAMKQKSARYYREHREMRRKYAVGYYAMNKAEKAKYYERNRERILQYRRDYVRAKEKMKNDGRVEQRLNGASDSCQHGCKQRAVVGESGTVSQVTEGSMIFHSSPNGNRDPCQLGCRQRGDVVDEGVLGQGNDCVFQEDENRESASEATAKSSEDKSNVDIPADQGRRKEKDRRKRPERRHNPELAENDAELLQARIDSFKEVVAGA